MAKKALLVGINNFTRPSWKLNGCVNDTLDLQNLLQSFYGFTSEEIRILHDKDASQQAIRDNLGWLLNGSAAGDVLLFHFSSHGTQVDDQGDDEWECLDEVIVPYDHDWHKPFRDDELRELFGRIPAGVNFNFIADCCHSGSIQRELLDSDIEFKSRYIVPPREIRNRIKAKQEKRDAEADAWASEELSKLLLGIPVEQWAAKIQEFMALLRRRFRENKYGVVKVERHVLLAACEDRQTAADATLEGTARGAFTWALGKAIRAANGDLTYDQLITRTAGYLGDFQQKPQLECPEQLRGLKVCAALA